MDRVAPVSAPASLQAPSLQAAQAIEAAAVAIEGRMDAVADALMAALAEQMPELLEDEGFLERTLRTARASVALITAMARTWTDPRDLHAPHEALEWARQGADRGLSSETLLRAYRLGHARYWELWFEELRGQPQGSDALAEATAASSAFFFRWIDAISRPLLRAHDEQRERSVRSADAVRSETVRAILDGGPLNEQAAAARLGYELAGWHLAIIAWVQQDGGDWDGRALEDVASELACRLAGPAAKPLVVHDGALELWAWVHSFEPFDEARLHGPALDPRSRVRVAVGRAGSGIGGFRESHLQARAARRVARLLTGGSLVSYDDETGVLALLTHDVARARRFVGRTLGPLARRDEATRRLLETLRVFQEEGQSFARTAARLNVHQNTAAYRVRRALELAGKQDASSLALRAAVALAELVGGDEPPAES